MVRGFLYNNYVETGCVRTTNESFQSNFQNSVCQLEKVFLEPE